MQDGIQRDGISDAILSEAMGMCAEKTVKDYHFTRQMQDEYALSSYERAANAWKNGDYTAEVSALFIEFTKEYRDYTSILDLLLSTSN